MSSGWKTPAQALKDAVYQESRRLFTDRLTGQPLHPNGIVTRVDPKDEWIMITWTDGTRSGHHFRDFEGKWNDLRGRWDID